MPTNVKPLVIDRLRKWHLLGAVDRAHLWVRQVYHWPANQRFSRRNPGIAMPPAPLAFEEYGQVNNAEIYQSGLTHAAYFADHINAQPGSESKRIVEWGCGAARILRHLPGLIRDPTPELIGLDVDRDAVAWANQQLPDLHIRLVAPQPPLPLSSASYDALYHYSVLTHLSGHSVHRWCEELARILKPGGIMVGTTHGDSYWNILLPDEQDRYAAGQPVIRSRYREGRKYFLSFFPPSFMVDLLSEYFSSVTHVPGTTSHTVPQDTWIAVR